MLSVNNNNNQKQQRRHERYVLSCEARDPLCAALPGNQTMHATFSKKDLLSRDIKEKDATPAIRLLTRPKARLKLGSSYIVGPLEPRFVHRLQRRRIEGQILAVGLRVRDQDCHQAPVDRDNLVDHRGTAEADDVARLELRNCSAHNRLRALTGDHLRP
jgi:hypothetical protein